jgi:hypothetical protein
MSRCTGVDDFGKRCGNFSIGGFPYCEEHVDQNLLSSKPYSWVGFGDQSEKDKADKGNVADKHTVS